jgi:hypothetical protein
MLRIASVGMHTDQNGMEGEMGMEACLIKAFLNDLVCNFE